MIKKGDFIEMDFTAKIDSTGQIFDTTIADIAKENNIYNKEVQYKPLIAVVGEGHLVRGLDEYVEGKAPGKYTVKLSAEKAFGKKDAKLLRLISIKEFHKQKINPMPGLEVEIDGNHGLVRTVNGGRVIVDFNHPLASQELTYEIHVKKIIEDSKEKIEGIMNIYRLPFKNIVIESEKATIELGMKLPEEIIAPMIDQIKKLTGLKDVVFKE